ncbi:hypothetical protein ACK3SF_03995 [Candidatus Nanosalina sp. VS9-1]|uniref:hypothetical protein n=1 Tax=Candidatus Nanosalina sp. VS9-1 TaxID=3388566 RepID=UPI0039E1D8FD
MTDKTVNIYFGRFHFHKPLDSFTSDNSILDQLKTFCEEPEIHTDTEDGDWKIGGVEVEDGVIYGKLGRILTGEYEEPTWDEEEKDFVYEDSEDTNFSYFAIIPSEKLIMYERKKYIGHKQFRTVFVEGFNNFYNSDDLLEINFIEQKGEFKEILSEASSIPEARFKQLEPTNPDFTEESKKIDNALRGMNAESAKLEAENEEESLKFTDGSLLGSAIALVSEGYGEFSIDYIMDGERKTLTSGDKPIRKEIVRPAVLEDFKHKVSSLKDFISARMEENNEG